MPLDLTLPPPRSLKQLAAFLFRHPKVRVVTPAASFDATFRRFACRGTRRSLVLLMRDRPDRPPRETEVPLAGRLSDGRELGLRLADERLIVEIGCDGDGASGAGRTICEVWYEG